MSTFCFFISFHLRLLSLPVLSLWPVCRLMSLHVVFFVALSPFILALCGFICFHGGFLWLYLLSFWCFVPSSALILALCVLSPFHFNVFVASLLSILPFCRFMPFHFVPFVALSPFIFAFCRFMSFHFGPFVASCPFMSAFEGSGLKQKLPSKTCFFFLWVIISFHLGFLSLHVLHFGISFISFWPACRFMSFDFNRFSCQKMPPV